MSIETKITKLIVQASPEAKEIAKAIYLQSNVENQASYEELQQLFNSFEETETKLEAKELAADICREVMQEKQDLELESMNEYASEINVEIQEAPTFEDAFTIMECEKKEIEALEAKVLDLQRENKLIYDLLNQQKENEEELILDFEMRISSLENMK